MRNDSWNNPQNKFCRFIADKIKQRRKEKGLTQKALARKLKISQQMISRIENGKENISLLTLKNVVDSLEGRVFWRLSKKGE